MIKYFIKNNVFCNVTLIYVLSSLTHIVSLVSLIYLFNIHCLTFLQRQLERSVAKTWKCRWNLVIITIHVTVNATGKPLVVREDNHKDHWFSATRLCSIVLQQRERLLGPTMEQIWNSFIALFGELFHQKCSLIYNVCKTVLLCPE